MAITIATYYSGELEEWRRTIAFYLDEMDLLAVKLEEVIRRNSIPGIAAKVEEQQHKLDILIEQFGNLQLLLNAQATALKTDSTLIDDSMVKVEVENQQNNLRQQMTHLEKACIETRQECHNFLLNTFRKRKG